MMQVACTGVEVPFIRAFNLFQREGEEVLVVSLELYASVRCVLSDRLLIVALVSRYLTN